MNTLFRFFAALSQPLLGPEICALVFFLITIARIISQRVWLRGNQSGMVPRGEWKQFLPSNFIG
jgi:hypothetical protein